MRRSFKYSFISLFVLQILTNTSKAQVTFTPSFATQNDSITIIYDATQGNGDLEGFTGDVYLHTGVITNLSSNPSEWKYVPNGWETYLEKTKATPLGDDKWSFTYGPSVRDFFGITNASENVEQIAMLFRGVVNNSITAVGRGPGGADIFISLAQPGDFNAQFLTPSDDVAFVQEGDTIQVKGLAGGLTGDIDYQILLDGVEVATATNDTVSYELIVGSELSYSLELIATHVGGQIATDEATLISLKENDAPRPAGTVDGINYINSTTVRLSLFAPNKNNVFVLGDFNDYRVDPDFRMFRDSLNADSTWFWLEIDGLTPTTQVGFQYLVDNNIKIHDPYSPIVLDPFHDQFIPSSTYPNLKPYPSDFTDGIVGVMFPGAEEYPWEVENFEKPDKEGLVIYELLIRDFFFSRNFTTLIDTLDYLENLGINAIELMPVSEFDGNLSWGYNPFNHIALDKFYGSPNEFKRFVDECHKRGIAVILDVVMNHASDQNSFYQLYPISENPYFNEDPRHDFNVFNDFNHQYSGTQYYNKRMIEHWINEYKIDGFRWDLTKGFTQNCVGPNKFDCTQSYNSDRVAVLKKYADYQWAADPDFYVIFEHLGSGGSFNEEIEWANYRLVEGKGIMLWGKANSQYNEATMGYHESGKSNLLEVQSPSEFDARHRVGYMESHDEQWLMFKNISFGNSSGSYDVTEFPTALDRMEMAGAFFFLLPGPKMMWQFGELGYGYGDDGEQCLKPGDDNDGDCAPSVAARTGQKPIRWDYYQSPNRKDLYNTWANLIELRFLSPAFTDPVDDAYGLTSSVKSFALEHPDTDVFVIGNFDVIERTTSKLVPNLGTWYDYFSGDAVEFATQAIDFTLAPGEWHVYTTKQFALPTSTDDEFITEEPIDFKLLQNYPNPFNPTTTLEFQIPNSGQVKLSVYDILGREVATLIDGRLSRGSHTATFDAQSLGSGIYIARLQSGNNVSFQKMTLIK